MKKTRWENFRVVVEVQAPWLCRNSKEEHRIRESMLKAGEDLKKQILRHCDDVSAGAIDVMCDEVQYCSHCGNDWEIDEEDGMPVCCRKAIEEESERRKNSSGGIQ